MKLELNDLKTRIESAIAAKGIVLFRSFDRDPEAAIRWNARTYPDPEEFIEAAARLGVQVICFHDLRFEAEVLASAVEEMRQGDASRAVLRDFERDLRRFREFEGFLCSLELSFDHGGETYLFTLQTEWYQEYLEHLDAVDDLLDGLDGGDEGDEPGSMSGYFSKN
jgi:hypothetical protein